MNYLGKILVVLITLMSLIFMASAATVYGVQRNWEDRAKSLESDLQESRNRFNALQDQLNRVESELQRQVASAQQQNNKLETERQRLLARSQQIQAEVDQLTATNRESTAAVAATEQNNARITQESEGLRSEIRETQAVTDGAFRRALTAVETLAALEDRLEVLDEQNEQLTVQNAQMAVVMRENGLNPATPADAVKPSIDGFVSAIRRRGSSLQVEVTIGADDGLRQGHTVEVFRDDKYLGRVEILKTAPDRAVGRVDKRFQEGRIQEGDRVATRLRIR